MQIQTSRRVTEPREKTTAFVKAGGVKCRHRDLDVAEHISPEPKQAQRRRAFSEIILQTERSEGMSVSAPRERSHH